MADGSGTKNDSSIRGSRAVEFSLFLFLLEKTWNLVWQSASAHLEGLQIVTVFGGFSGPFFSA